MWQRQKPSSPKRSPSPVPRAYELDDETARRYQAIADDVRYRHFTKIPARIVSCLDYFRIRFDHETVQRRLLAHYLFIGVVDDATDSGQPQIAEVVFGLLKKAPEEILVRSDIEVVTHALKAHIEGGVRSVVLNSFWGAYQEVLGERAATSIDAYIEHRKALGRLTAEQSYLLIQSALGNHDHRLRDFMQDVGAVGCLIDSIIDLRHDSRAGLLAFEPKITDYAKLYFCALREGLRVWARKPRMTRLFAEAILDNIRDRGRARVQRDDSPIALDRKDQAAGVA